MEKQSHKPSDLIYSVDDIIPLRDMVPLVLQQVIMLTMDLIYPVLIVASIGGSIDLTQSMVCAVMLVSGLGSILQGIRRKYLGSGYLCLEESGSMYLTPSLIAAQTGGLPLVFGMTVTAGLLQGVLSRLLLKLRVLFPPEISGLVVALVALDVVPAAINNFFCADINKPLELNHIVVSIITVSIMIGTNVWGKGKVRQYGILIGLAIGYVASYVTGVLPAEKVARLLEAGWLALPSFSHVGWQFDINLLAPFAIAAVCSSVKTIGNITTCQKANDADWKRLELTSTSKGVLAEGVATTFSGVVGGMGLSSSSGSIGLSIATGATSRYIGIAAGALFMLLALLPKVTALLAIMPRPVAGALLVVSISYVVVNGFQVMLSRMLDSRKIFVIGTSLLFGLSVSMLPQVYQGFPALLNPIFKSTLATGALCAIVLNLLFRIGIKQTQRIVFSLNDYSYDDLHDFMDRNGAMWGARKEVIDRSIIVLNEFFEAVTSESLAQGEITVNASFDEYKLVISLTYQGEIMEFSAERPTQYDLLNDDKAFVTLAGYMINKRCDKIKTTRKNDQCYIEFHFEQ